jgi:hypothetical protein
MSEILQTLKLCKRHIRQIGGRKFMRQLAVLQFERDKKRIESKQMKGQDKSPPQA